MKDLIFSVFPSENFVDLGLYQFGWERCKPAHSFGPAARNHYLFHYIMSGTGRLITTDENGQTQSFSIKSRQGFMIYGFARRETERVYCGQGFAVGICLGGI